MPTFRKNFSNMDPATIPVDDEYIQCNFTQTVPDTSGADPKGVRLFPGDDTPRIFRNCNLVNCEVPPGSTVENCNTTIKEFDISRGEETITVDGQVVHTRPLTKQVIYGRVNPSTGEYIYLPIPDEVDDK